jgi:cytoskeleton protein RodZ
MPSAPAGAHQASPRAATRRIQMRVANSSWVEVKAGDGQVLLSQVLEAGSDKVLEGSPPFSVVIGAAHGVALVYNGEPVNLAPYTVVDVARLSLN